MKANLLLLILIIGFNSSLVAQTSQVITDSVTINGRVTDYDNHPLDNVSVSWARPDFSDRQKWKLQHTHPQGKISFDGCIEYG